MGTGKDISINDLIELMGSVLDVNPKIVYEEERIGDVKRSVADITKIKKELGFEPRISLEEGLKELLKG